MKLGKEKYVWSQDRVFLFDTWKSFSVLEQKLGLNIPNSSIYSTSQIPVSEQ